MKGFKMQQIVIVEDDESIRELVIYALESNGFEVKGFETGREFFESRIIPDLVLLDIVLPETDGFSILKEMRGSEKYAAISVIILSAKTTEFDKVRGLNTGADDYITKPFGIMELISRVNAVLRRRIAGQPEDKNASMLMYKNISVNKGRRSVSVGEEKIMLTYKEYELLNYLISNAEMVVSRDKIIDKIWGCNFCGESRTVDMHVKTLRQKLGTAGKHIKTIRNVGYKIGE
jgi:two-component system alkaline phosphatase synthesis response regulator PhoP